MRHVSVEELADVLLGADGTAPPQLVDVREEWEAATASIPGFQLFPLSKCAHGMHGCEGQACVSVCVCVGGGGGLGLRGLEDAGPRHLTVCEQGCTESLLAWKEEILLVWLQPSTLLLPSSTPSPSPRQSNVQGAGVGTRADEPARPRQADVLPVPSRRALSKGAWAWPPVCALG